MKNLDYKVYDFSKELIGDISDNDAKSNVVIVDIDEKSLTALGQWPWSRIILAQLINKINSHKPASISLDIVFPEKDRTSPKQIISFYKDFFGVDSNITGIPNKMQDNDLILASAIKNSNATLSLFLSQQYINDAHCKNSNIKSIALDNFTLDSYPYILCNTPKLFDNFSNFGFINTKMDEDGLLRRYVLAKRYKEKTIPSLGLATLLNIDSELNILKNGSVEIMDSKIKLDGDTNVLLNFYEDRWYKKISAIDILTQDINATMITGKIVLIGASAVALNDQVMVPPARNIAGVQVHATFIDNLIHKELLLQPHKFATMNIFLSFFLTMILFILLIKKENTLIIILFLSTLTLNIVSSLYMLNEGIYISIGYLFIPFVVHFLLISLLFIFIDTYDKKLFAEELNHSHIALVDSMAYVAEIHDLETGAHIIRTKKYIKVLAERILEKGIYPKIMTKKMIEMMYATAPMHDIGKVGIPDAILKKEGELTPMEYEVMKTHPNLGMHILNNAISAYKLNDFFIMARNITHYHHEKWDGTGYPNGLKGEEIPLEARFMAISDVYDALVSKRVYKEAISFEKSIEIIIEGRGTHFDPQLVDALVEFSDDFQEIAQKYSDN